MVLGLGVLVHFPGDYVLFENFPCSLGRQILVPDLVEIVEERQILRIVDTIVDVRQILRVVLEAEDFLIAILHYLVDTLVCFAPVESSLEPSLVDEADDLDVLFLGARSVARGTRVWLGNVSGGGCFGLSNYAGSIGDHGLVLATSNETHDHLNFYGIFDSEGSKVSE